MATQYYGLFNRVKNSSFSNLTLEPASIFENPGSEAVVSRSNYYKSIGKDTLNNRRTGSDGKGGTDIVLDENNTYWWHAQWAAAGEWTGSSTFGEAGNLDIDID